MIVKRAVAWRSGAHNWSFDAMPVYNSRGQDVHKPLDGARAMPVYRYCVKCPAFRIDDGRHQLSPRQVKWGGALLLDVEGCD